MNNTLVSRRNTLWQLSAAVAATALLTGCAVSVPANIQPVQGFDAGRYMGKWYEIARIDQRFQKGLTKAEAKYSLNDDGSVKVTNRGYDAEKKSWKEVEGKALFLGDPGTAALKVSFFGPFYGGYNVVYLDPDYQTSLVIGDSTESFWLLSRRPDLPKAQVQQLLQKAQAMGVDLQQVIQAR